MTGIYMFSFSRLINIFSQIDSLIVICCLLFCYDSSSFWEQPLILCNHMYIYIIFEYLYWWILALHIFAIWDNCEWNHDFFKRLLISGFVPWNFIGSLWLKVVLFLKRGFSCLFQFYWFSSRMCLYSTCRYF